MITQLYRRKSNHWQIKRWLPLLFLTGLCMFALTSGCLDAATVNSQATIVVKADRTLNESGKNDMAVVKKYFSSASRPESNGGVGSTWSWLKLIGQDGVRIINADGCALDEMGNFVPCDRLEWSLSEAKELNIIPHIVVGQFKPEHLPDNAWNWDRSIWEQYQDYAYKFVRYIAQSHNATGFNNFWLEVTNEWDITTSAGHAWLIEDSNTPVFDPKRYDAMFAVYRVWQAAVDRVAKEFPSKTIQISGPALTVGSFTYGSFNWMERFIDDVNQEQLRLDALTYHYYGDQGAVGTGIPHADALALKQQLQALRNKLKAVDRGNTPIRITEWGPSSNTSDSDMGRINYTHEGGAWTAAFFKDALSAGLNQGVMLISRDNFGADTTGKKTEASFTHLQDEQNYPKPVYNVARMFKMLPGTRKQVTISSKQPNIGAIASASKTSVGIVAFNYKYKFDWPNHDFEDMTVDEPISILINNMPFSGQVTVKRYLVDANTSNLSQFLDAEQTPDLNKTKLQQVETFSAAVNNGTLSLGSRTLGKSAVSLWLVSSSA